MPVSATSSALIALRPTAVARLRPIADGKGDPESRHHDQTRKGIYVAEILINDTGVRRARDFTLICREGNALNLNDQALPGIAWATPGQQGVPLGCMRVHAESPAHLR